MTGFFLPSWMDFSAYKRLVEVFVKETSRVRIYIMYIISLIFK